VPSKSRTLISAANKCNKYSTDIKLKIRTTKTDQTHSDATEVTILDLDGNGLGIFANAKVAADFIGFSRQAVYYALHRGFVIKGMYRLSISK
jgi:hypothetical protein